MQKVTLITFWLSSRPRVGNIFFFFIKGQTVNILGFVAHMISTLPVKVTIDNM